MTWADEAKNHNDEPKKSRLLPTGDQTTEIVELLVAMYRAVHNPDDVTHDDTEVGSANHQKDTEYKKEGEEQTR